MAVEAVRLSSGKVGQVDIEASRIGATLDRCPRCETSCTVSTASMTTTDDLINCWSVFKSVALARLEQFLNYAQAAAPAEQFYTARDVLLEAQSRWSDYDFLLEDSGLSAPPQ